MVFFFFANLVEIDEVVLSPALHPDKYFEKGTFLSSGDPKADISKKSYNRFFTTTILLSLLQDYYVNTEEY